MLRIIATIIGTVFLLFGLFFFFVITVDMTSNVRLAGPMNLWPPPLWVFLIADTVFALLAVVGMKLTQLDRREIGLVLTIISALVLVWVVRNQLNAPPRDGLSDGRYIAADLENYIAAYIIAGSVLLTGGWLIIRHFRTRRLS